MNPMHLLQHWLAMNADGDWEHENGIRIISTDNFGWHVELDLVDTVLEGFQLPEFDSTSREAQSAVTANGAVLTYYSAWDEFNSFTEALFAEHICPMVRSASMPTTIYWPVAMRDVLLYYPIKAKAVDLLKFEIADVSVVESNAIKARKVEDLEAVADLDLRTIVPPVKPGQTYRTQLLEMFDYPVLVVATEQAGAG